MKGYLIHLIKYRETSAIMRFFTEKDGVKQVLKKGVFGNKKSPLPQPFQLYSLNIKAKGEMNFLNGFEVFDSPINLHGMHNICGVYVNELLYKLLHENEAHPQLFQIYQWLLDALNHEYPANICLRRFELLMLKDLGYGIAFDCDNQPINSELNYIINEDYQFVINSKGYPGKVLLAIIANDYQEKQTRIIAKKITRIMIDSLLHGRVLYSRLYFHNNVTRS